MESLQTAIVQTIVYFDLFNFAPTLLEMERYLLTTEKTSIHDIQQALESLSQIDHANGVYFLRGREELALQRRQKYDFTDTKWKHARWYIRLLTAMPGVEAVWLTNSMGWGNASRQSDIDLCIITNPGKIWTARFFTTTLMKLLRQRPQEQTPEKALCLSLYIASDQLNLERYRLDANDIHFLFWTVQMYPLYDPHRLFECYTKENAWVEKMFTNVPWLASIPQRTIKLPWFFQQKKRLLTILPLESFFRQLQLRILPKKLRTMANTDTRVVLSNAILKLHDNDSRVEYQHRWKEKVKQYMT